MLYLATHMDIDDGDTVLGIYDNIEKAFKRVIEYANSVYSYKMFGDNDNIEEYIEKVVSMCRVEEHLLNEASMGSYDRNQVYYTLKSNTK